MFMKVCGITRVEDALHAVRQGATALGFVFWSGSPRAVDPGRAREIVAALPPGVTTVGVFVNESTEGIGRVAAVAGLSAVQLHGEETRSHAEALTLPVYRSVTLDNAAETVEAWPVGTTFVLDASDPVQRGGTGRAIDWVRAAAVSRTYRVVLAGGLTPHNVERAIATVRPFGVDVSSGVESAPGVKDAEKVSLFLANARRAFAVR